VEYTAVSADTPAQITISAPGGTTSDVTYKVLYIPSEPSWCTFPSRVTESPLRVSKMTLTLGGKWNGTTYQEGKSVCKSFKQIEWTFNNNLDISFQPCQTGDYAGRAFRPARSQTLRIDREMRETILQTAIDNNETLSLYLLAEGALYDGANKYSVEIIFPSVGILNAPVNVDGKVLGEAGDIIIFEDTTYGSVIVNVQNLVATYAA
jgi:hypothetical protein